MTGRAFDPPTPDLQELARASCAREAFAGMEAIDADAAALVLEEVETRRAVIELRMKSARNGRIRSPLRKEHWWLGQLAELLQDWLNLARQ